MNKCLAKSYINIINDIHIIDVWTTEYYTSTITYFYNYIVIYSFVCLTSSFVNITRHKGLATISISGSILLSYFAGYNYQLEPKGCQQLSEHDTILSCHGLKQIQRNVLMVFQMDSHLIAPTLQCIGTPHVFSWLTTTVRITYQQTGITVPYTNLCDVLHQLFPPCLLRSHHHFSTAKLVCNKDRSWGT